MFSKEGSIAFCLYVYIYTHTYYVHQERATGTKHSLVLLHFWFVIDVNNHNQLFIQCRPFIWFVSGQAILYRTYQDIFCTALNRTSFPILIHVVSPKNITRINIATDWWPVENLLWDVNDFFTFFMNTHHISSSNKRNILVLHKWGTILFYYTSATHCHFHFCSIGSIAHANYYDSDSCFFTSSKTSLLPWFWSFSFSSCEMDHLKTYSSHLHDFVHLSQVHVAHVQC